MRRNRQLHGSTVEAGLLPPNDEQGGAPGVGLRGQVGNGYARERAIRFECVVLRAGPFATMTSGMVAAPPNGDALVGSVSEVAYGIHGAGARGSHDLGQRRVDDRSRDEERLSRYERWGGLQPGNQPVPVSWRAGPVPRGRSSTESDQAVGSRKRDRLRDDGASRSVGRKPSPVFDLKGVCRESSHTPRI